MEASIFRTFPFSKEDYVVVGSLALYLQLPQSEREKFLEVHGRIKDVDLILRREVEYWFYVYLEKVENGVERFRNVLYLEEPGPFKGNVVYIDFLSLEEERFKLYKENSVVIDLKGVEVRVLKLEEVLYFGERRGRKWKEFHKKFININS